MRVERAYVDRHPGEKRQAFENRPQLGLVCRAPQPNVGPSRASRAPYANQMALLREDTGSGSFRLDGRAYVVI
jgi:hypothetical protein